MEKRSVREAAEISELTARIASEMPQPGTASFDKASFDELPLSKVTLAGLRDSKFKRLTRIQRIAIPHALAGRDVLGAAKTGSGKTLAFLVPVVERLFRERWGEGDGVGALVISPTRELALQIFDVLRGLARRHDGLTAALITGGKDFGSEQDHVYRMNILVCTPGRLLQHFEQTPGFHCEDLKMLVLDEADRILDMGFEQEVNQILSHLPPSGGVGPGSGGRQTLLFSATQTKSVKQLARLSLTKPEFVSVHEQARFATPERLKQHLAEVELPDKLDVVYSFIRSHLRQKVIVFLSSCKQVRFVYEGLRRMRPGVPLMALHGKVKPARRNFVYRSFVEKKVGTGCVLFATDIAARGLDFPGVDWVIQADCPEDVETYIHRVGRTARFKRGGRSLLLLAPSERHFQVLLEKAKIPAQKIAINPDKLTSTSIRVQFSAHAAQDTDFKYLAQKAFISYMRSVYLRKNKQVFDIRKLPAEEFAASMGLPSMPQIKILSEAPAALDDEDDSSDEDGSRTGLDKMKKKNKNKKLERLRAKIRAEKKKRRDEATRAAVAAASAKQASKSLLRTSSKSSRRRRAGSATATSDLSDSSCSSSDSSGSSSDSSSDDSSSGGEDGAIHTNSVIDQLRRRKNPGVLSEARQKIRTTDAHMDQEGDDVLVLKRRIGIDDAEKDDDDSDVAILSLERHKRPKKRIRVDGSGHGKNVRKVFDDEGNAMLPFERLAGSNQIWSANGAGANATEGVDLHKATSVHMSALAARLAAADKEDKKTNRARIKENRIKQKEKAKVLALEDDDDEEAGSALHYQLGSASDSVNDTSDASSSDSDSDSSDSADDNGNMSMQGAHPKGRSSASAGLSAMSEAEKSQLLEKMLSR
jgi:ATP-dependent RNA helicase DDX10/DBP4